MICLVLLSVIYALLMLFVLRKWSRLALFVGESQIPNVTISLVIAARNEAANIGALIAKIAQQNFPQQNLEVIIIDDKSTDETADIIKKNIEKYTNELLIYYLYIKNGEGKKTAITQGVAFAKHDLIVTTDADCLPATDNWLRDIALFYEKTDARMIAAPVVFYKEKNALGWFQTADFVAMMAVTAAGITSRTMLLCNGANLAYRRSVFAEVNGFEGNMQTASGDDMFLMHKISTLYPSDIHFLKSQNALILTEPKHTWRDFLAQRLRWGTKNTAYKDWRITAILGVVWLYCISFFIFTILFIIAAIFGHIYLLYVLCVALIFKMTVDFLFLYKVTPFFDRKNLLSPEKFLPSFFIYLFYMLAVGSLSLLQKKYVWKGRTVE